MQTLSRLNRTAPGKADTFVLDFVNDEEDVRTAFQPFYQTTTVSETADPQHLYTSQHHLEQAQVFTRSEVEAFATVFYAPKAMQTPADHAALYAHLRPAEDRFRALPEDKQDDFRVALGAYVKLYAFLSQIVSFADTVLERDYLYGRALAAVLPSTDIGKIDLGGTPEQTISDGKGTLYAMLQDSAGSVAVVDQKAMKTPQSATRNASACAGLRLGLSVSCLDQTSTR